MRILTFADMGIGNLVYYLPVLKALSQHNLTVICNNEELRQVIDYNVKCGFKTQGAYDVSVNNFLCQRKQDMVKIWRIKKRIGHDWIERRKFVWMFTDKIKMNKDKHEMEYNSMLCEPLGLQTYYSTLSFPDFNVPEYDILISAKSSKPEKDWAHWDTLITKLKKHYNVKELKRGEYPLIVVGAMINKCKMFIGNDSGLVKIADNLCIPSIQIFRWWTDSIVRARIKGSNLIEPLLQDVLIEVETLKKNYLRGN
jgi:ADP-heptose:LPS heptosyltransferase